MKPVNLEELDALAAKATEGPWRAEEMADGAALQYFSRGEWADEDSFENLARFNAMNETALLGRNDAALIVALRNEAPAISQELRELRARVAELEDDGLLRETWTERFQELGAERDTLRAENDELRERCSDHAAHMRRTERIRALQSDVASLSAQLATATRIEADIHGDLSAFDARLVANTGSHVEFKNARATVRGLVEILLSELENKNTQLATAHDDAVEECASLAESIPAKQRHSGREFAFELRALKGKTKTNGGGA